MLLKLGVDISRLERPIRRKLNAIDDTFQNVAGMEAVVTSTYEGTHSASSLHYSNNAIDCRCPIHAETAVDVTDALKSVLGNDFDVILEHNHIHIEYDPKEV